MKRKEGAEAKSTLRERVADVLDVSKDIVLDAVLLTQVGNRELMIENYKSILSYSETCIRIKAKPHPLTVMGTGMEIRNIDKDLLYITGRIQEVAFEEKGRE